MANSCGIKREVAHSAMFAACLRHLVFGRSESLPKGERTDNLNIVSVR